MINRSLINPANMVAIGAMLVFLVVLLWAAGQLAGSNPPA